MIEFIKDLMQMIKILLSRADCYYVNSKKKEYIKIKSRPIYFAHKKEDYDFAIIHIPFEKIKVLYIPDKNLLLSFSNEAWLRYWINIILQLIENEIIFESDTDIIIGHIVYCKNVSLDEVLDRFKFEKYKLYKTENVINVIAPRNENLENITKYIVNTLKNISKVISIIDDIYVVIGSGYITIKYGERKLNMSIDTIKDTDIYMLFINDIETTELIKNYNLLKRL